VLVLNLALSSVNDKSRLTFVLATVYTATDFKSYQISKNLLILARCKRPHTDTDREYIHTQI